MERRHTEFNGNVSDYYELQAQTNLLAPYVSYRSAAVPLTVYEGWANGWEIGGFHRRQRNGELLPHTPYHAFRVTGSAAGTSNLIYDPPGPDWSKQWIVHGKWVPDTSWIVSYDELNALRPELERRFVDAAAAKIWQRGHDTLTFLTELRDVRKLFVDTVKRILGLKFPKDWRQMSNDWLSYRYGWRVLLFDLNDLTDAIVNLSHTMVRLSEKTGDRSNSFTVTETTNSGFYTNRVYRYTRQVEILRRGSVVADIAVPKFKFDLIQTAWEKIPYSFVFDWIINVGQYLSTLDFIWMSTDYTASVGCLVKMKKELFITTTLKPYCTGTEFCTASSSGELRWRVPTELSNRPHLNVKIDGLRLADLISLLFQRIL